MSEEITHFAQLLLISLSRSLSSNFYALALSLSGLTMCKINVNILFTINLQK